MYSVAAASASSQSAVNFEARLAHGAMLKKIIDSIKDLVTEGNFDCSETGIKLQAMDSSHVALVSLAMNREGFEEYKCLKPMSMGINIGSMAKLLKCAGNEDFITLRAGESSDSVGLVFENPKQTRDSNFDLKLMEIDSEHLGIPDTQYSCVVSMSAGEFQRICREIAIIGDTVTINCSKEGVRFSVAGDMGSGSIALHPNGSDGSDCGKDEIPTIIKLDEEVNLTFALRYLNMFAKASSLSDTVTLKITKDVPLVVEYGMDLLGHIRFYLAPKIEED